MRTLITGGAGFVGSSLAIRLKSSGIASDVVCLDNLWRKGSELNVARLSARGIEVVSADVRMRDSFDLAPFDLVIDAAAEPSVMAGSAGKDVDYVVDTNLVGTLNLLEAARKWSSAVVFLSTSRVYPVECLRQIELTEGDTRFEVSAEQSMAGISPAGISEQFPINGARTLYGATKYASEVMALEYGAQFGLPMMINRFGVIAGPWQMGRVDQGIVALWVAAHHYGNALTYMGYGGKQVRDVLHIEDMLDLIAAQIAAGFDGWGGDVYNVGGGSASSTSLLELSSTVREVVGRELSFKHDERVRAGDVPIYVTDNSKVSAKFKWKPSRGVEDVVNDTARWIADNDEMLRPIFLT